MDAVTAARRAHVTLDGNEAAARVAYNAYYVRCAAVVAAVMRRFAALTGGRTRPRSTWARPTPSASSS